MIAMNCPTKAVTLMFFSVIYNLPDGNVLPTKGSDQGPLPAVEKARTRKLYGVSGTTFVTERLS